MLSITFTAVCQPAKTYSCLAAKVALSTRMHCSALHSTLIVLFLPGPNELVITKAMATMMMTNDD